jgi:hypothetical protein
MSAPPHADAAVKSQALTRFFSQSHASGDGLGMRAHVRTALSRSAPATMKAAAPPAPRTTANVVATDAGTREVGGALRIGEVVRAAGPVSGAEEASRNCSSRLSSTVRDSDSLNVTAAAAGRRLGAVATT